MEDKWKRGSYIATCIIAVVAVLGFLISIRSSHQVSIALERITEGMASLTIPLIKFKDYKWAYEGEEITCNNPPKGIFFNYQNVSNVPIQTYKQTAKYFYGKKKLDVIVSEIISQENSSLRGLGLCYLKS